MSTDTSHRPDFGDGWLETSGSQGERPLLLLAEVGNGSTSDRRVSDLTAGKLTFQLSDRRADVRGRQ